MAALPGLVLIAIFLAGGSFWVFGPWWSWMPFAASFTLLSGLILAAGPERIAIETPIVSQGTSAALSFAQMLMFPVAIGLFANDWKMEILLCFCVYFMSAILWPRLRTLY